MGLRVALPGLDVAPVAVLLGFFVLQAAGTERSGMLLGVVMLAWFATLGALGFVGVLREPAVLPALDLRHALDALPHAGPRARGAGGGVPQRHGERGAPREI